VTRLAERRIDSQEIRTMRSYLPLAALALGAALVVPVRSEEAGDIGKKMTDPVSQKSVTVAKETPLVVVNGTKLYFTDAKSRETFLKTPETYVKQLVECPVRGAKGKAQKANRLVVNDQLFYFCCTTCPEEFKKDPGTYAPKLTDVVSGKEFSPSADAPKSIYKGATYLFASAENKSAFDKEPMKYAKTVVP
jgi:YHS domain-containing protein